MKCNKEFMLFARELEAKLMVASGPLTARDLRAMSWKTIQKFDRCLVCQAVHWLRQKGVAVASGQRGYEIVQRGIELDDTLRDLLRRDEGLHEDIRNVRNIRRVLYEQEKALASLFEQQS